MDFLDQYLAELGPEEKEQLLASVVAGLSPINEATAPGPILTAGGDAPAFEVVPRRRQPEPFVSPTLGYTPSPGSNELFTVDLGYSERGLGPDQTAALEPKPMLSPDPEGEAAIEVLGNELLGKDKSTNLSRIYKDAAKGGMNPNLLFTEPVPEAEQAAAAQLVLDQATAPASTETTEPLAEQVATSGVMQPTGASSMDQVRMRTRGVDRTNDQYQRRLQLSRLLELQALRQLQKAEQVKAQPRSLMDLYRGGYERRAAAEAQRRINMARQYFNRSGAIQRELVRERDIERKAAAAEQRAAGLDAALQERIAKRKGQEAFQKDKLAIEGQKVEASLARLNTLTPYQKGILANMRKRASTAEKKEIKAMASQMRGTWQGLLREANDDLVDLRRQETNILRQLSSGFVRQSTRENLESQLAEIQKEQDAVRDQRDTYQGALATETEQATGVSAGSSKFDAIGIRQ